MSALAPQLRLRKAELPAILSFELLFPLPVLGEASALAPLGGASIAL